MVMFPFRPNWAHPVNESLEWKTDVLRSRDGTEQRRSLRVTPRRSFEYQFNAVGRESILLEDLLLGWQDRNFVVPVWNDSSPLTASSNAGASSIQCDTTGRSFVVGDMAAIYRDTWNYELVTIQSMTATTINLLYPTTKIWEAGVRVFPAVLAHLQTSVPTQRLTNEVMTGHVIFSTSPEVTNPYLPAASPEVTYDGLEVMLRKFNWRDAVNNDFLRDFFTVDAGTGPIVYYNKETNGRITRQVTFLLKTRDDAVAFRQFLRRARGQAKSFWVPSWHRDFKLMEPVTPAQTTLTVEGSEFYDLIGVNTTRDRIMLRLVDGTNLYRRITNVALVAGNSVLTIDSQLGVTVNPADVRNMHVLLRCRMATDKVIIPWRAAGVAEPQLTFTTVPA